MKTKIFTLFFAILLLGNLNVNAQINLTTGTPWGLLSPGEPLVVNENFQGYEFFHSDASPDEGNSEHKFADDGITIIPGYKSDTVQTAILGSSSGKVTYDFHECAFAPEWATAYAFRDAGGQTPNVSDGFVEISRFDTTYSDIHTLPGYLEVDLRELDFVEVIQWTHSSTGGSKRGAMCKISIDDRGTWDTLRYQPGELWGYSFTKDITTGVKTSNGYRCDPSAYGMTWEDGVYASNVILRFEEARPPQGAIQTVRIHDLKVYGTYTPPTAIDDIRDSSLKIYSANKKIIISEPAKVAVYSVTGTLVRMEENTERISMENYPVGIYIVKAQVGSKLNSAKVVIK
ncbi:T9SS type A sorting domain-containing protein [Prolixibacteraceae bacterium Z1-6]|uniref:T9SS type A sorting domain-containing protein n=1 Tax=Draconibacterium aestuarii TaxID=2998507 RepID=A0A9X3F7R4_9BACT|nr:T9SS type A sorting domain-containing protein [Prolixibacteraceae bacterium Z1-6]